ncbi:SirB1 family protein [Granulibacter bethesdensis]|uniref:SirB1 family protein n=1 Tax=Granulibacter bethesdensis TaxID=364410 RepID=UPI00090C39D4|nr:transglutaminase-like domain-containing protein [Granulibacter bethesdensis]APH58397.1 Tetratricopeptide repeat family protein [Granulibacter bethesdensis]
MILEAIGQLPDDEIDLADAALQLARRGRLLAGESSRAVEEQIIAARAHLTELAQDGVMLAAAMEETDLSARAGILAGLLQGSHGYAGDDTRFPDFADLLRVIERRAGLPVALGILWIHTARAAGWEAYGLDFPGRFLVCLQEEDGPGASAERRIVLDVFEGGIPMTVPALRDLLKKAEGASAELRPDQFRPMSNRGVLLRLQNNLRARYLELGAMEDALACSESMLMIAPDEAPLWRETALMNQRLDRVSAALRCFERFLILDPDSESARRARAVMQDLRSRLH